MKHRNSTIPALLACVTLQLSVHAFQTDMWFGTIRPPLAPPSGDVTDRIFIGDNFEGLVYADQDLLGQGTTATMFYTVRHDIVSGLAHLDTIGTPIAPHVGPFVVDQFSLSSAYFFGSFGARSRRGNRGSGDPTWWPGCRTPQRVWDQSAGEPSMRSCW
jgi:hypothetical protein